MKKLDKKQRTAIYKKCGCINVGHICHECRIAAGLTLP